MQFRHLTKAQKIGLGVALFLLLIAGLAGALTSDAGPQDPTEDITQMVTDFGEQLDEVSLLAPQAEFDRSIDRAYGPYLTPELLASWKAQPQRALGRQTSSPWPDRIEVATVTENFDGTYTALGSVIEVQNNSEGAAAIYPVAITVIKEEGKWRIQDATKGSYTSVPERRFATGTYVCLPQLDAVEETETAQCAFGIQVEDGTRYALDFTLLRSTDVLTRFITGEEVRVEGTFVPIEHVRSAQWRKYAIEGVIRVTALQEL